MKNAKIPHFGGFCPKMHFWAELDPQNHQCMLCYGRISAPGRKSAIFCKISVNSWNFMKFHEISRNFREFHEISTRKWKGGFGIRQVAISGGDFTSKIENFHDLHEKVKFPWISWHFKVLTKPHFLPQSALWAIWVPKTINIPCAMEGFPPRAGKVRFSQKVAFFAHFHTFRENHPFSWFLGFLGFPWKNIDLALYRWQEKLRSHFQGRQLLPKSVKWWKWALFSKNHDF